MMTQGYRSSAASTCTSSSGAGTTVASPSHYHGEAVEKSLSEKWAQVRYHMFNEMVHISTMIHAMVKLFTPMCSPRDGDHQTILAC